MKYLLLSLCLLGCEAPSFSFDGSALPCSIPSKITHVRGDNVNGCWRLSSKPGHGIVTEDPSTVSCSEGAECVVIVDGETFWTMGAGENIWQAEDVDCSEVCKP